MRHEPKQLRRNALWTACIVALASNAASASAQDDAHVRGDIRIEVTGSNIARVEAETALPVQIIKREEIANAGIQTAQDLIERVSANQSFGGWNEAMGEGNLTVGYTAASLRGLGAQRTLVLLNGQRLAPYALSGGQSVDLSAIPASVIDRVEILKDGASAIYGTDAIGGVINFILRRDFAGVEAGGNYFATEHGGGNNGRVNATAGYGDLARDRFNAFASVDYYKQHALKAAQRESTRTAYIPALGFDRTSGNSFPANILQAGFSLRNPTIPPGGATADSCAPPYSYPTAFYPPRQCRFDTASVIDAIPDAEKWNAIGRLTWQFHPRHQLFAEASYYRADVTQRVASTPVTSQYTNTPMTLPPTSPYYPAAFVAAQPGGDPTKPIQLRYRLVELGPRIDVVTAEQWRGVLGVRGSIGSWDYQVDALYTSNRQVDDYTNGYVYEPKFGPLLRSGVVNPFGYNTPAVLDAMRATQVTGMANDNRASHYGGDAKLSGTLYELPSGPLALAFGVEGRRESLEQANSDFIESGDVVGGAGAIPSLPSAHRTVLAAFAELDVPIVKSLEANVAVRYDHYSDFGSTTNPKLSLRWQPMRELLLRASWGTGFRAPTLSDIFQPAVIGGTDSGLSDPLRCPVTQSPDDCSTQFVSHMGGNRALQPETSRQWNAGVVVAPTPAFSASVDYYRVRVRKMIDLLIAEQIFADPATWDATRVVRGPVDPAYPDLPGPILYVYETNVNFGDVETSGVDLDLRWRPAATPIGKFALSLTGTYVIDYNRTTPNNGLFPTGAGTRAAVYFAGALVRWRHFATLDWSYGPWAATLAQNYQNGYNEPCVTDFNTGASLDATGCTTRRVGSYSVFDLQTRYTGFRNLTLTLGVRNVFDTAPPVSNQMATFQTGVDPLYADPRGRTYYAAIRYAFR